MIRNMRIPDGGKLYTENRIDGMRATATNTSVFDEDRRRRHRTHRCHHRPGLGVVLWFRRLRRHDQHQHAPANVIDFKATLSQEAGSWGFLRTRGNVGASASPMAASALFWSAATWTTTAGARARRPAAKDAAAEHKKGLTLRLTDPPDRFDQADPGLLSEVQLRLSLGGPDPRSMPRRSGETEERGPERRQSAQRLS
jgi:hypothetical protein